MWTVCITSVSHVLKVNGYRGRQAKENEKSQCFKRWETLVTKKNQSKYSGWNGGRVLIRIKRSPHTTKIDISFHSTK